MPHVIVATAEGPLGTVIPVTGPDGSAVYLQVDSIQPPGTVRVTLSVDAPEEASDASGE